MRILIQSRSNFYTLKGGDTVQLLKTKEQLEKRGIEVDLSLELQPDLSKYDIVHLSNLTRVQETYVQMINAKKQGKPIVLSTIYWPTEEFEKTGQIGLRRLVNKMLTINVEEKLKAAYRYLTDKNERNLATQLLIIKQYTKMQQEILENVNYFLPNSKIEMDKIGEYLGFYTDNYVVVPNGIDKEIINSKKNYKKDIDLFTDAIICVGRIDTRKNQLNLVKALDGSGMKLILVGAVSKNHLKYFNEIKKYIDKNKNFHYFPYIDNDELYKIFEQCKVSALPSWFDTPGLVSLEAAAMGCNLAISTKGTTKDYFEDMAFYCEPDNIQSIRDAVDKAWNASRNQKLKELILSKYTWEKAAECTIKAYEMVLSKN